MNPFDMKHIHSFSWIIYLSAHYSYFTYVFSLLVFSEKIEYCDCEYLKWQDITTYSKYLVFTFVNFSCLGQATGEWTATSSRVHSKHVNRWVLMGIWLFSFSFAKQSCLTWMGNGSLLLTFCWVLFAISFRLFVLMSLYKGICCWWW